MAADEKDKQQTNETGTDTAQTHEQQGFVDLPSRYDRWEPLAELIATAVLAIAMLTATWSGYQASRWGGVMSTSFSQAGAMRVESTRASTQAGQIVQADIGMFSNWINAFANDDEDLANFYFERFRPEFQPAFEAWLATDPKNNPDAPDGPFGMSEYQVLEIEEAQQLVEQAEEIFAIGRAANQTSDDYVLLTVILASVLFLAGIQSRFTSIPARFALIVFSMAILAYGLYNVLSYPIE